MIAFEVTINGRVVCTAGVGERGVLFTDLICSTAWAKHDPTLCPKDLPREEWIEEEMRMSVRGVVTHAKDLSERLLWIEQSLSVGDEIVIRILDDPVCDEPNERRRYNPKQK